MPFPTMPVLARGVSLDVMITVCANVQDGEATEAAESASRIKKKRRTFSYLRRRNNKVGDWLHNDGTGGYFLESGRGDRNRGGLGAAGCIFFSGTWS